MCSEVAASAKAKNSITCLKSFGCQQNRYFWPRRKIKRLDRSEVLVRVYLPGAGCQKTMPSCSSLSLQNWSASSWAVLGCRHGTGVNMLSCKLLELLFLVSTRQGITSTGLSSPVWKVGMIFPGSNKQEPKVTTFLCEVGPFHFNTALCFLRKVVMWKQCHLPPWNDSLLQPFHNRSPWGLHQGSLIRLVITAAHRKHLYPVTFGK